MGAMPADAVVADGSQCTSSSSNGGAELRNRQPTAKSEPLKAAPESAAPPGSTFDIRGPLSALVWPAIVALPLFMTYDDSYQKVLPHEWQAYTPGEGWPAPLGLCLGLLSVVVGQVAIIVYHYLHRKGAFGPVRAIQSEGARPTNFMEGLKRHLTQPEGFVMVGGWLVLTWMFNILPQSYYNFEGGINWLHVAAGLLLQDGIQCGMHLLEHRLHTKVYQVSHKPHHKFVNPVAFDAFDGSLTDTLLMILVPLTITTQLVHCNVWSYMTIGSLYSSWLTLIHSEYVHPWDWLFRLVGFGTAGDHHVHHKTFIWNYGHLFMYWDRLFGTYKSPADVRTFNKNLF